MLFFLNYHIATLSLGLFCEEIVYSKGTLQKYFFKILVHGTPWCDFEIRRQNGVFPLQIKMILK